MKNIIFYIAVFLISGNSYAQEGVSIIKHNNTLDYRFDMHGQIRPLKVVINEQQDTLALRWSISYLTGVYEILPEAVAEADGMTFAQGKFFGKMRLASNETFLMLSRKALRELIKHNTFVYNNTTYDFQEKTKVKVGEVELEVIHVKAQIDETEMWVINDPDYPFLYRMEKNPFGLNFKLINMAGQ